MGLAVTVRDGEDFYIDDDRFVLSTIVSAAEVRIVRARDGAVFFVTYRHAKEIEAGVFAQVGDRSTTKSAKLVIDAPRQKLILTGINYRTSAKGQGATSCLLKTGRNTTPQ